MLIRSCIGDGVLTSFVDDSYLEKFYPDIVNYRRGGQTDYSGHIAAAVEQIIDSLVSRNLKPRLCMVPLDMNRLMVPGGIQQLTVSSVSAYTVPIYGVPMRATNQRRAWINVTVKPDQSDWTWYLMGSNSISQPLIDGTDESWEDILNFNYAPTDQASTRNTTFVIDYKWYGYRLERNVGNDGDVFTFKSALYETVWDRLIAYKALELIFRTWATGINSQWDVRVKEMRDEYDALFESLQMNYDWNEDGYPDELEGGKKIGSSFGSISAVS